MKNKRLKIPFRLSRLAENSQRRRERLQENWAMLQFFWKADVVESWILEKQAQLRSDDCGHNLSSVQNLLARHDTFNSGLQAFESEGIKTIRQLRDQLSASMRSSQQEETVRISHKFESVIERWQSLLAASDSRRSQLRVSEAKFRDIEELYLLFAKKVKARSCSKRICGMFFFLLDHFSFFFLNQNRSANII